MTRLQKKCLIAAAGTHLLVVVVVLCSGFIASKPKPDDTQVLDVIPANVLDNVLNTGSKTAPTPPPQIPVVKPVDPPPPIPDPPKPTPPPEPVKHVEPVKPPEPVKPVKDPEISIPPPKPPKPHVIKVNKDLVTVDNKQAQQEAAAAAEKAALAEKKLRDQKLKAIRDIARNVKENSSKPTVVDASPGTASVSYANYASVVKSRYDGAWTPPDDMASDDVTTKVSVTISRDGTVVSSRIIGRSGEARVDASVQRALDRVDFIAPFPEGAKEKERTFIINFNPQARRLNG